jgi:hypothetical protein
MSDTRRIAAAIRRELPLFQVKGSLLFVAPVGEVLRGVVLTSSGFDKMGFNVDWLVQPLHVPLDHLVLDVGGRLSSFDGGWECSPGQELAVGARVAERIGSEVLPRFRELDGSPGSFIQVCESLPGAWSSAFPRESLAYCLFLTGTTDKAMSLLEDLASEHEMPNLPDWCRQVAARCRAMAECMKVDPDRCRMQLEQWVRETRSKLKLPAD